jgi:hypothetical protein
MDDRFSNRQDQALARGFAVLIRFAWILAMAIMIATFGAAAIALGLVVGILFGSLRLK